MICSTAVPAATYSDPKAAILTVACFLNYQSIRVLFNKCTMQVTDFPDNKFCIRLASTEVVVRKGHSSKTGTSESAIEGRISLQSLHMDVDQSIYCSGSPL